MLASKYRIIGNLGKGTFGAVYKASLVSEENGSTVAIKVHRNNPVMRKAGNKEDEILQKVRAAERPQEQGRFIVNLMERLEIGGHLCLIYELLEMNARELLEKFGKDRGISLKAVQIYARQLCAGLAVLKRCHIIHGDIKPDNILISSSLNLAKLCDFGTAMYSPSIDHIPYLASRFYRAPEVILGSSIAPLGCEIDIWSLGCTLFELYSGQILFPGHGGNREMLQMMIGTIGKLPAKLIKTARSRQYLDLFKPGIPTISALADQPKGIPLYQRLKTVNVGGDASMEEPLINFFIDFLQQCLQLDPTKRISSISALLHPFLKT